MAAAKEWNLRPATRLGILLLGCVYLLADRPWSAGDPSVAGGGYGVFMAWAALAVLPKRTRLVTAVAIAVGVAVLATVVLRRVLAGHA